MIETNGFASRAEHELRDTRTISPSTRRAWEHLPDKARRAFDQAMVFLGSSPRAAADTPSPATAEADRTAAARLMLVKLGLDGPDPRWSSDVLDRLLNAVTETPEGGVGDLFHALFGVLRDYSPELTKPVAALLKDLVVRSFTLHRRSYDSVDWDGLVKRLGSDVTRSQLYLALHAIPPQFVSCELANAILKGLEATAYHEEAVRTLAV